MLLMLDTASMPSSPKKEEEKTTRSDSESPGPNVDDEASGSGHSDGEVEGPSKPPAGEDLEEVGNFI